MEKDSFYFVKLFILVVVSMFAGVCLTIGWWFMFGVEAILAIALSIKMASSYDHAWDKE